MKIYTTLFVAFFATQIMYCYDGWWEKIETKNIPSRRVYPAIASYEDNKLIMFGGSGYYKTDTIKQDEIWLFNYETKEWTLTDIKFPLPYNLEKGMKYRNGNICKVLDNKILFAYNERASGYTIFDSSLWLLDVYKKTWKHLRFNNNPDFNPTTNDFIGLVPLTNSRVIGLQNDCLYDLETLIIDFAKAKYNIFYTDFAPLGHNRVLVSKKGDSFKQYNPNLSIYDQDFKFRIYDDSRPDSIGKLVYIFKTNYPEFMKISHIDALNSAFNVGEGKVMYFQSQNQESFEYSKDSYIFEVTDTDTTMRLVQLRDEVRPPVGLRSYAACKIAKDKILLYGGWYRIPNTNNFDETNDVWIFHISPDLASIEIKPNTITKSHKISTERTITINSESRIVNTNLYDMIGNPLESYRVREEASYYKIDFELPKGIYCFTAIFENGEKHNFLINIEG